MTRILSLDIATSTGWACFDNDKHPSSIECGVLNLGLPKEIKGAQRRKLMRGMMDEQLCRLFDRFRPDVACLEQPLNWIKPAGGGKPKRAPKMFKGDTAFEQVESGEEKGGPNADTVLMLNQVFAVADTVCSHKAGLVIEVAPKSWQTLTSRYPGETTKERSQAWCRTFGVVLPAGLTKVQLGDAADAAAIAFWASGHCQQLKLLEHARAAA